MDDYLRKLTWKHIQENTVVDDNMLIEKITSANRI